MSSIEDTAYPWLREEISEHELENLYTPTAEERAFVNATYRRPIARANLMLQLKLVQRLGYAVPLADVPLTITAHVCRKMRVRRPTKEALAAHDASGEKTRHLKHVLKQLGLREFNAAAQRWLATRAEAAAKTKHELPDIINVLLEELVKHRYVLPGFTILLRMARAARERVNTAIFSNTVKALTVEARQRLDELLIIKHGKSDWDRLKREPRQPTVREVVSFLQHIRWLTQQAEGLPTLKDVAATKLANFTLEARALDVSDMRTLTPLKRYTLAALLVQAQLCKATDDIAEIFVKTQKQMDTWASKRLVKYQQEHTRQVERLIGRFRDVLTAYQQDKAEVAKLKAIRKAMSEDPEQLIAECDEHMAYADNNYFPFMLPPYRSKRALLFECLDVLSPVATYTDDAFTNAIAWVLTHRNSHKERLNILRGELDLTWLPEKWRRLAIGKEDSETKAIPIHRKYFELCVLERIREELQSGDLYVANSERYDDYRERFVDEKTFRVELPIYGEMVDLPIDPDTGVSKLQQLLIMAAENADLEFPGNDSVSFGPNGLILHKNERLAPPEGLSAIDQAINELLGEKSILDILIETEHWLDLHKIFGPLSGYGSKLEDPRKRFIATLFCYGFNMGASQTARSLKGLSRKQIAWLNLHHITEERLDKAIVRVINTYNKFTLPSYWGSGKSASADGTKWALYEKNLMSEYHIRYGGYGGIGYYHVSDTYIALFSHFIPCGVYEAVYILDGLIRNTSDIQPDTLHGDTHAQNTPVFGLAYLLGIDLMPRIRHIKDLIFFKPSKDAKYKNIQQLFTGPAIDWELIRRHYLDMMRVAVSIKAGKIVPSTLMRRLGSNSRKNKLYFAFRELGRVIRTIFLLRYISDPHLRGTIHAATNKSEQFNNFAQWSFFGNDGVIAENIRHEQRKVVKYNHLVANMIILHNVQGMSRAIKQLQTAGHEIDHEILAALSPYRTSHINRYGDYLMDLRRKIDPLNFRYRFH